MAQWPWRYRSRSKIISCNTLSYSSCNLCHTSRTVHDIEQAWQDGPYFSSFYCKITAEWSWRYRSRSKVILRNTPSHASDHLCQMWKESTQNCMYCRVYMTWQILEILLQRCMTRSEVIMHDTTSHASDDLCLICKESIQNCRHYRADTRAHSGTDVF